VNDYTTCRDCGTTSGMDWWMDKPGYWKAGAKRSLPVSSAATRCRPCYNEYYRARRYIRQGLPVPPKVKATGSMARSVKASIRHFQCDTCGVVATSAHKTARFCSDACRYKSRPASTKVITCQHCGDEFFARRGTRTTNKYCGRTCQGLAATARVEPKPPPTFSPLAFTRCKRCDAVMVKRRNRKYCGDECRRLNNIERVMELYDAAASTGRVKEAMHWRRTMTDYLAERDGVKCGICRKRVDVTLTSGTRGDPMGPSIDHVVPRSKGGTNDLANLRLTHWACNNKRGNRGVAEQLSLIG